MELTKVSTWVQGSPHFGQESVFLFFPLPPLFVGLLGGGVVFVGGSPEPNVFNKIILVDIGLFWLICF